MLQGPPLQSMLNRSQEERIKPGIRESLVLYSHDHDNYCIFRTKKRFQAAENILECNPLDGDSPEPLSRTNVHIKLSTWLTEPRTRPPAFPVPLSQKCERGPQGFIDISPHALGEYLISNCESVSTCNVISFGCWELGILRVPRQLTCRWHLPRFIGFVHSKHNIISSRGDQFSFFAKL